MLKYKLVFLLSILLPASFMAQKPVNWSWNYEASTHAIQFKVELSEGWHVYSQHIKNDVGPVPTQFVFEKTSGIELVGEVTEPTPVQKYDENFEATLNFFEKEAVFTQKIKGDSGEVKGTITYMVCNETMCLPPVDLPFLIALDKN